jgi:hypothetical protein
LPITPDDDTFIERIATPGQHERGRGYHHSDPPINSTEQKRQDDSETQCRIELITPPFSQANVQEPFSPL